MNAVKLSTLIAEKAPTTNIRKWELSVVYPALKKLGYLVLRAGDFACGTRCIVVYKRNRETMLIHGV